ncbi:MAG: Crp/Fnr family transcriptional regulator [Saprospiraceae bacterium]
MDSFKTYLKQFPHYTDSAYENALPFLTEKTIKPGEFLLKEGRIARNIAFIDQGILRLFYLNGDTEVTNCFCRENSITCSYKSLILQEESTLSIQAIEESKVLLLSYDSLQKLYALDPFWQQIGRLAAESEYITSESHHRFLKDLSATERYLQVLNDDEELLQRVPLNYLATYLQVAPATLSRIRKKISRT